VLAALAELEDDELAQHSTILREKLDRIENKLEKNQKEKAKQHNSMSRFDEYEDEDDEEDDGCLGAACNCHDGVKGG
jgi:hypothetical protein